MNHEEREQIIAKHLEACKSLRESKGVEYSNSDDANANFRSDLDIGIDEISSLSVFANKHYRAIRSFVRTRKIKSEPIQGRIHDLINYLLILLSMLEKR